jgi:CRP/FNR family transcriptional regulator, cyclic AMP receptor protein
MSDRKSPTTGGVAGKEAGGRPRAGAILSPEADGQRSGPPPLLLNLNHLEAAEVLAAGTRKVIPKGAKLFGQGTKQNGIFLVESGRIKVFYTAPSGREITLAYWHPGNFVGGPDVFENGIHVWSGAAAVNSSVLHLPGAMLRRMIMRIPTLGINIIEGMAFKGRCYSGLAQMLGTRSATERLAHLLLQLAELYGIDESGGVLIAAGLTHADIANMIGSTRQWVTMNLTKYMRSGILKTHGSSLVILQLEALRAARDHRTADLEDS